MSNSLLELLTDSVWRGLTVNVGHLYKYQSGDCSGGAVKSSHISCSSSCSSSEAQASVPGPSDKLGEWVIEWLIEKAIFSKG